MPSAEDLGSSMLLICCGGTSCLAVALKQVKHKPESDLAALMFRVSVEMRKRDR